MAEIGTATVKVLPDLAEFYKLIEAADLGLTLTDTTVYEHTADGMPVKTTRTVRITRDAQP